MRIVQYVIRFWPKDVPKSVANVGKAARFFGWLLVCMYECKVWSKFSGFVAAVLGYRLSMYTIKPKATPLRLLIALSRGAYYDCEMSGGASHLRESNCVIY